MDTRDAAGPAPEQPLVTLAVKAYRQEATVRAAIESVFAQSWPNLEILLSDDCSPDGTFAVMEEMAAAYTGPHRVRLNRNARNLGIVGHENLIWEMASGQLVGHCAGDDRCAPDRIAREVAAWAAGDGEVFAVHTAMQLVGRDGEDLGIGRPHKTSAINPGLEGLVRSHASGIGATALYDKRIYDAFGPIALEAGVEDRPLFLRAAMLGRIAYIDAPLLTYCVDGWSGRKGPGRGARDHLYGSRMKVLRWQVETDRLLLADAAKIGFKLPDELDALCRNFIRQGDFQLRLSTAGWLERLGLLAEGFGMALQDRSAAPVLLAGKYAAGRFYVWASDWRNSAKLRAYDGESGESTVKRLKWDYPAAAAEA